MILLFVFTFSRHLKSIIFMELKKGFCFHRTVLSFHGKHLSVYLIYALYTIFTYVVVAVVHLLSRVQCSATPWTSATRLPCPSPSPEVCSSSCPLSGRCHPPISSSVVSFSSCLQSFPASGSLLMLIYNYLLIFIKY